MHLTSSIIPAAPTFALTVTAFAEKSCIARGQSYGIAQNLTQRGVAVTFTDKTQSLATA